MTRNTRICCVLFCLSAWGGAAGCGGDGAAGAAGDLGDVDLLGDLGGAEVVDVRGEAEVEPSADTVVDSVSRRIPTTNEEHNQMLEGLGFSTALGGRLGPDGQPLPDDWHPLRTRYAAFYPKQEVYLAGVKVAGSPETLFDDSVAEFAALDLLSNPDTSWIGAKHKNAIGVDVDSDGLDEIFVVFHATGSGALRYLLIDPNDAVEAVLGTVDLAANPPDPLNYRVQPSLAVGDIDGDGLMEIAVGFGSLYVVDGDIAAGTPEITRRTFADNNEVFVAIGNIDPDPVEELVVTYTESGTGMYQIIKEGDLSTPAQSGMISFLASDNKTHTFGESFVAMGDVDGDRLDEVVFHGREVSPNGHYWRLALLGYDPGTEGAGGPGYVFRTLIHHTHTSSEPPWTLVCFDTDGDGVDEIFAWNRVVKVDVNGEPVVYQYPLDATSRALAGNVDADPREELLLITNGWVRIYGLNGLDEWVLKKTLSGSGTAYDSPAAAICNVDLDSPIVRYDGDYELLFTEPQIVAVMASPPYHDGIGQDVESTTATFGKSQGRSVMTENSLGFSVGFSVGYEFESPLFQSGFSVKTSFESAFDWYASQTKTVETFHSYTTAPGQDKVVFTSVPFDVYYYTVVSSPMPEDVGRVVTVNLPRTQQVMGTSTGFFNAHNGGALDVDARTLEHRLGDVWSYPSADGKDHLLSEAEASTPGYQRLWNGPIQVDESGCNTLGLSTSEGSAQGASMDFSVTFEWESKTGGATVGGSVGYHYGHTYEFSSQESTFYEGTVGAIPGPVYAENMYCYGLMVYPRSVEDQTFIVMNWWTQPQCPGP